MLPTFEGFPSLWGNKKWTSRTKQKSDRRGPQARRPQLKQKKLRKTLKPPM